jgi:uncharacterized protein YndB with AHSA1/START domain
MPATASTADREIVLSRTFDAPRELVFKVWTDPAHVPHWWGPRGFTTTTHKMEVKPGGVWRYVMHGPDGHNYENIITYVEVVRPERLVYKHGGDVDTEPVNFLTTVTFEERSGKTTATMRSVFPSTQARDHVVKNYGAIEGGKQHLERLGEYLSTMANNNPAASPVEPFVISRVFKAPRDLVWKAWTERDRLMQWFGPKGFPMTKATLDMRPGGTFHYCMVSPAGQEMWGKFTYREISPQDRIVLVSSFSDEKGGIAPHPMSPTWPLETLSTTTFADHAGIGRGTVMTIKWSPLNASAEQLATFNAARAGMTQGWTGTFEQLDEYLAKA